MKVDPNVVKEQLSKVQVQFHRFPNTYAVIAIAHDEKGFYLGTGVGACVDPSEFNEETGKHVAKENALKAAEDKLWEIEGILLRDRLRKVMTVVTEFRDSIALKRTLPIEELFNPSVSPEDDRVIDPLAERDYFPPPTLC